MTNETTASERERFEREAFGRVYDEVANRREITIRQIAWHCWKAARAALPAPADQVSSGARLIDTADHVLHKPSGETWLVAMVEADCLTCCGWPESIVPLSDCSLVKKATPEERLSLLHDMARSGGRRGNYAKRVLGLNAGAAMVSAQHGASDNSEQDQPSRCEFADDPRGCYRVRCQLGKKCVGEKEEKDHP